MCLLVKQKCYISYMQTCFCTRWLYASWNLLAISCLVNVGNEAAGQNCLLSMAAAFYDVFSVIISMHMLGLQCA
ncbi:hypothetical protein SADUNF_Sadunf02G0111600 [Salix dunnii]|uniref:Uncharacterized protein n=1 Tax=Salix dunnii TaxID=1413687 RepID=A0A835THK2_9ROSI|nr:hypothetical protein SADUNF_Sadunf02G0111600 [Salix dunnii]